VGESGVATSDLREITGDLGKPNVFFSQLVLRILRTLETTAPESTVLEGLEAPGLPTAGERGDTDLAQTLQVEILRNQAVLYNLDQDRFASKYCAPEDPAFDRPAQRHLVSG
jgi:hypothetical protein